MVASTFYLSFYFFCKWGFAVGCSLRENRMDGEQEGMTKCYDGALVSAANAQGMITRLQS